VSRQRNRGMRLAFLVAVAIKGLDGLIETTAGVLVAIAGTLQLYLFLLWITAPELDIRPASGAAHLIRHGALGLAQSTSRFIVVWLLGHGIVKLALAIELLRGKAWIFPVAVAVLAAFVGYMAYRLAGHWSPWLFAFALLDTITIALVLNEWRAHVVERTPVSAISS
jgi:uncharacterized membrane protein